MVKFRGIEINAISQFDIRRLPEFKQPSTALYPPYDDPFRVTDQHKPPSPLYPIAICSIPIYPGSQIWFEYTIDGPHPSDAAYFFKLLINGVTVTSWDCTTKHGFYGKMMYNIVYEGQGAFKRQALRFGDEFEGTDKEDVVQINVHRIEKRVRIRDLEAGLGEVAIKSARADGLRLTNSGLLDPGARPRRYKYQLLDPVDTPYAAFQFHCRSCEFLEAHRMEQLSYCDSLAASSSITSSSFGNIQSIPNMADDASQYSVDTVSPPARPLNSATAASPTKDTTANLSAQEEHTAAFSSSQSLTGIRPTTSEDSLSVKTKDSIEELSSNVPRSPRSPVSSSAAQLTRNSDIPPSPTRSPGTARRRLTKKLTVNIDGTNFDIEKKKMRPLSPFNGGGVLRRESFPQTAPAVVSEFGPTIEEEVQSKLRKEKPAAQSKVLRTTAEDRGGRKLMSFLGRRIMGDKGSKSTASAGEE